MTPWSSPNSVSGGASLDALEGNDLTIGYPSASPGPGRKSGTGRRVIAAHVSVRVVPGQCLVILGPNGSGKTTLLRTLLGGSAPLAGEVLLGGKRLLAYSTQQRARSLAYVPQSCKFEFPFRVLDLVAMGRAPHLSLFASPGHQDFLAAEAALAQLGIGHLADARESEISGGERQLVLIARALVQQTRFLLLDEPTANLDLDNQARVLGKIDQLVKSGISIVMTSHAPGHAFVCATQVALLDRHGQFAVGPVTDLLTEKRLAQVYGLPIRLVTVSSANGVLRTCVPDLLEAIQPPVAPSLLG